MKSTTADQRVRQTVVGLTDDFEKLLVRTAIVVKVLQQKLVQNTRQINTMK